MFQIVEPCAEYSKVIEYSFIIKFGEHNCSGLLRSASAFGAIECENTIIWDTYHPNFPRLTPEEEGELIDQLFANLNNT